MADPTTPDTRLTQAEIQELKRLVEQMTPAPWGLSNEAAVDGSLTVRSAAKVHARTNVVARPTMPTDGVAIAALRNAAPALLAMADESSRLREALAKSVERECAFNCDAESTCTCMAHRDYRAALAPPKENSNG